MIKSLCSKEIAVKMVVAKGWAGSQDYPHNYLCINEGSAGQAGSKAAILQCVNNIKFLPNTGGQQNIQARW